MTDSVSPEQIARLSVFRDRLSELLEGEREEDIAGLAGVLIGNGAALLIARGYTKEQVHTVVEEAATMHASLSGLGLLTPAVN